MKLLTILILIFLNLLCIKASFEVVLDDENLTSTFYCTDGNIPVIGGYNILNQIIKYDERLDENNSFIYKKRCLFKNVCIASTDDKFFHNQEVQMVYNLHLFEDGMDDLIDSLTEGLIHGNLQTSRIYYHKFLVHPESVIPTKTRIIKHRVGFVGALGQLSANVGHLLVDVLAALYDAQLSLGLDISKEFKIISLNGASEGLCNCYFLIMMVTW
jgi:hypothetical protein